MTAEITPEPSTETTAQALSIAVGLHEAGAHDRAELLLRKVLAVDGFNPLALYALGRVLRALGRAGEAMEPLSLCRSLLPDSAPVAVACAGALAELLRFAEAVELLDTLLSRLPDGAGEEVRSVEDALKSILALAGDQANQRGDDGEAIGFYRRLGERSPDDAAVWGTLGAILLRSGGWLEAEAPLRRAAELDPGDEGHTRRLADALKCQGRLEEAREVYRGLWVPRRASAWWPGGGEGYGEAGGPASVTKLVHDIEQLTYLEAQGRLPAGAGSALPALRELAAELVRSGRRPGEVFTLTPEQLAPIRSIYNRMVHLAEPCLDGRPLLNQGLDWAGIGRDFHANAPGYAVIDGLLSPHALAELRRYCLESTFWIDLEHPGGYLGAYLEEGFDHDILFRIARASGGVSGYRRAACPAAGLGLQIRPAPVGNPATCRRRRRERQSVDRSRRCLPGPGCRRAAGIPDEGSR
jgi:hypothetical protein